MRAAQLGDAWLVRLETGEEITATLISFAARHGIEAASVEGIGSVFDAVLGYFNRDTKAYTRRSLSGDLEILSLLGNLGLKEEKPFGHLHVVLGDAQFGAYAGHLFEGKTAATCELVIRPLKGRFRRVLDETTGLFLLDL